MRWNPIETAPKDGTVIKARAMFALGRSRVLYRYGRTQWTEKGWVRFPTTGPMNVSTAKEVWTPIGWRPL